MKIGFDHEGTPLTLAATHGDDGIIRLLLDAGADVHSRDASNNTALFRAVEYGEPDVVQLLFEADPNVSYCLSGNRIMNPSRFGICTLGSVWAFIVSFSPMRLFSERM